MSENETPWTAADQRAADRRRAQAQRANGMSRMPEVKTEFIYPPIPIRSFDYVAWYAGEEDEQMATGHGRTEAAAIADLLDNHPRDE
jgi:hypothetical protein